MEFAIRKGQPAIGRSLGSRRGSPSCSGCEGSREKALGEGLLRGSVRKKPCQAARCHLDGMRGAQRDVSFEKACSTGGIAAAQGVDDRVMFVIGAVPARRGLQIDTPEEA